MFETQSFYNIAKTGAEKKNDDPSNKILKLLEMGPIFIKNMTWEFGNFMKPGNPKTVKP